MNIIEKSHNKLVHLLFPFVERFFLFISLILILAAWCITETYWQIKIILFLLWYVNSEIYWAGTMERDFLPLQSGIGPFYHVYRFVNGTFLIFLLTFLVIMLVPVPLWLKSVFCGLFVIVVIIRAIGDRKYRPRKPEE